MVFVAFAVVGVVVAWHRPRNPIGWLMLSSPCLTFYADSGLYDLLTTGSGTAPVRPGGLLLYHVSEPARAVPLIILLFPDGRLPSPRWRWVVGGYLTLAWPT